MACLSNSCLFDNRTKTFNHKTFPKTISSSVKSISVHFPMQTITILLSLSLSNVSSSGCRSNDLDWTSENIPLYRFIKTTIKCIFCPFELGGCRVNLLTGKIRTHYSRWRLRARDRGKQNKFITWEMVNRLHLFIRLRMASFKDEAEKRPFRVIASLSITYKRRNEEIIYGNRTYLICMILCPKYVRLMSFSAASTV